jgi:hypothetical protein
MVLVKKLNFPNKKVVLIRNDRRGRLVAIAHICHFPLPIPPTNNGKKVLGYMP